MTSSPTREVVEAAATLLEEANGFTLLEKSKGIAGMLRALLARAEAAEAMGVPGEIAAERRRQVEAEGWSVEHDDTHRKGEMALAAAAYALHAGRALLHLTYTHISHCPAWWPWSIEWWKPKDRRRDLIRAAALIVAEVERLDRQGGSHD